MLLGGIVINEILVDPNGALNFDTDGNGTAAATDEYVELYNSSNAAIDISGLQLWDMGVGNWFTFPPGTILQAGGHALVLSGVQSGGSLPTGSANDLFFDAGRAAPLINNGGDNITLYDPTNDEFAQATFNGDALDNPTLGASSYSGFSTTATRIGTGEDFGNDTDGLSLQRAGDGADIFTTDTPSAGVTNVCFADGTRLATPRGDIAVEDLRIGDLVLTADHGAQPITWVFCKTWTPAEIKAAPNLAAVLIRRDALGDGMPSRDLRLSQQHRVMVQGSIAKRMFGSDQVLVRAKSLLRLAGVTLERPKMDVTYYHVMLARHEVVFSNTVPSESLYLGEQALQSIPRDALDELCTLLGVPFNDLGKTRGPIRPARPFAEGKKAKRLINRHARNRHAVVAEAHH
ncbi:Hint domain-containing protein [uncultured Sulfitobacter sp.]|uniref:Hint domain-containing protein n=1 Tax=uncultured Sulfitobacter sp. TaxID=191468 RepID=UPI0026035B96|nr:Hint domain-containing protein [uncultured Sulfitobacter sp.]